MLMRIVPSSMTFLWIFVTFGVCFCTYLAFIWNLALSIGIELVLGTRVKSADVRRKTLLTATGETISYRILLVATGARVLELF